MSGAPNGEKAELKLPAAIQPGAVLAGRYRVGRMLGSGGMGAVFAAEHVDLLEPVAIKVLLHDGSAQGSAAALGRFMREAWAASKIKSEYVARVSDLGRLDDDDDTPYIVMEYLDGSDLEAMLRANGPLEIELAVELALQACEALAEAHALGIFHRDLKPSNLFCVQRSDGLMAIKLLDFGISKIRRPASESDPRLTSTGATLGTPLYMSPEQMRSGRLADERSDIWSLGAILYELLSGRVPFSADNLADLAVRIATEVPTPLSELRAQVPPELSRAVARCLDQESARRFQNVAQLARAIAPFGPARAITHAERAERILQLTHPSKARITPMTSSTAITALGSHARLRGVSAAKSADMPAPRSLPKLIGWMLGAVLVGAAAIAALRWSMSVEPKAQETRASAAQTPEPAHSTSPAAAVHASEAASPAAAQAAAPHAAAPKSADVPTPSEPTQAAIAEPQPPSTKPASTAPRAAAQPPASPMSPRGETRANEAPASPAAHTVTKQRPVSPPPKAAEPREHTQPTAAPKHRDTQLDSLGGRL